MNDKPVECSSCGELLTPLSATYGQFAGCLPQHDCPHQLTPATVRRIIREEVRAALSQQAAGERTIPPEWQR